MRTTIITKLALVALLSVFGGGCGKQNKTSEGKTGEAFVVLKSGEVLYMADMQVVCLKEGFKTPFSQWRSEYQNQDKVINQEIENTLGKRIKELKLDADRIREEQKLITTETIQKINTYIKDSGLGIPYLKTERFINSDDKFFDVNGHSRSVGEVRPTTFNDKTINGFLSEFKLADESADKSWGWWYFYIHIPREMEGTTLENTIRAAGHKWKSLEQQWKESLAAVESAEKDREAKQSEFKAKYALEFYKLIEKNSVVTVRTGSKGDFIVPGEVAYLYAETKRENGEKIAWLVHVDPSSLKIKMSVSNAASAGSGGFDDFWMLRWSLD